MSPIFVRPVREQLEHDRLIRHLQATYKRKFEVATNIGEEQVAPVKIGASAFYPDLVLTSDHKISGLVEVETGESVNNLEAMAQWVHFSRAKVPFHLYVPVHAYDAARRFCEAHRARVAEIWTYRGVADGFDLVRIHVDAGAVPTPRLPAPKSASDSRTKAGARPKAGGRVSAKSRKSPAPRPARSSRARTGAKRR